MLPLPLQLQHNDNDNDDDDHHHHHHHHPHPDAAPSCLFRDSELDVPRIIEVYLGKHGSRARHGRRDAAETFSDGPCRLTHPQSSRDWSVTEMLGVVTAVAGSKVEGRLLLFKVRQ